MEASIRSQIGSIVSLQKLLCVFLVLLSYNMSKTEKPYQCPSSITALYPATPAVVLEHRQYSRQLYKRIKMWQLQIIPSPRALRRNVSSKSHNSSTSSLTHPQSRSFSLLEAVLEVTKVACPSEFVSHDLFLEAAVNAFHFLHDDHILGESTRYNADPITSELHARIDKILTFCQENLPAEKFSFMGSYDEKDCPNSLIRKVCQHSEEVPICKKVRMRNGGRKGCPKGDVTKYSNFVLDVIWNMVDLVHGSCFIEFRKADDLTGFHYWEQAMEQLFSRRMRKYWYQPGMTMEEYQAILHPNLIQQMHNLEMCVEGHYYLRSNYRAPRLQRPTFSQTVFKKK